MVRVMFAFFERLIYPYPNAQPVTIPQGFVRFVWECSKGMRLYILWVTILTAIIGSFEAILFAIFGHIVDQMHATSPNQLWANEKPELILLMLVLLSSILIVALQSLLKQQTLAGNLPMLLRWNFHRLMLDQSMNFYHDEFAGRVATKIMQTALAVRDIVMILTDVMVLAAIYFITVILLLGDFNIWLLVPFLGWLFTYSIVSCYFVPKLLVVARDQANARSSMTGHITDIYTNIITVKLFSHAQREAHHVRSTMQDFMSTVHQQMRLITLFQILNHTLGMLLIVSIGGGALWLWMQGQVSIGVLAAATAMALRLNGISHWIMWEIASLFEHVGTVQDGLNMMSHHRVVQDKPDAKLLNVKQGSIHFDNVIFGYDKHNPVIKNLTLSIRPNEKIGLVGRSGAGKSTLVSLLLRFYDIEKGHIFIDGQDITAITQESLRLQIGMVTQDTSLLHRSVRDNILYGRPDATDVDMIAAAKKAEAHEFIQTLIDRKGRVGYDAYVGERGVKLSGGQRQRIAIARVILKDPPILLLDEATSALDSEVEATIQSNLYHLMEGKTVVAIAHRLSTIAAMDRLVVLNQGRIAEEGDHKTLLAKNGIYARLWAHQSGGFLGEDIE